MAWRHVRFTWADTCRLIQRLVGWAHRPPLNLIYSPLRMIDLGVELEYGRKSFHSALSLDDADALRLGLASKIKFN